MYLYQNKILIEMKIGGKKKKSDKHKSFIHQVSITRLESYKKLFSKGALSLRNTRGRC